ncbi:MAG: choice-of-anchor L domain-containing protein [Bacteroidota bacterium]
MKRLLFIIICALFPLISYSQLTVSPGLTATQLAQKLAGAGVQISNATITGPSNYYSSFTANGTNLGLTSGILLTTGNGTVAVGPNADTAAGTIDFNPGDLDLENIVGVNTYDAAVLEFDFIPQNDTIQFRYVFASEEYPEYVCSSFNDLFGFFISGPGITGTQNIAIIPGTTTPVAINTVNNGNPGYWADPSVPCNNSYPAYYVDNTNGATIEYDGFTTVLTARALVTPCQTYHLKIVITDAGDPAYDSGVFLEEGSMSATPVVYAGPDASYCTGAIVPVGNTATSGWTYAWTPTTGVANPTVSNTSITLNNSGGIPVSYTYVVTATNGTCVLHDTIVLTTLPTPISSFTPVSTACANDTISVQYTGNANSSAIYNWSFSGAVVVAGSGQGPYQLYYPTSGTYPLALNIHYNGCPTATANDTITINASPIANFTVTDSICAGSAATVINSSTNTNALPYNWSFGTGTVLSGSGAGPYSIQFTNPGNTTVNLTLGTGACSSSISKNVFVKTLPIASLTGPSTMCSNDTITITFNGTASTNSSYAWNLGSATAINNPLYQTAQIISTTTGKDTVRLIVNDKGCLDTTIHIISIYQQPIATFLLPDSICYGDSVTITSNGTSIIPNATYSWIINGGNPANFGNTLSGTTLLTTTGNHQASLTINNNGCIDQFIDSIYVNPLPIVQFSATNACEGSPVILQNQTAVNGGSIFTQLWSFGDNQTSNLYNPGTHTYLFDGPYTITLTATSNHLCTAKSTQPISIYDTPIAGFASDSVCFGKLMHLNDTSLVMNDVIASSAFSYNSSVISNNSSFAYLFNAIGTLPVQLITTSGHGCVDTIIKNVIVNSNPVISFTGGPLQGCDPLYVNFTEILTNTNGSITDVSYLFGDGDSANYTSPLHIYTTPGVYDVTLTATSQYGCMSDTTYNSYIHVYTNPVADFYYTPSDPDIFWPYIHFINTSLDADFYSWTFGDSTSSSDINPEHAYSAAGTYPIELIATTTNGCADTTFGEVIIKPTYTIYVPNAFSPNNDNKNEVFQCKATNISNFKMSIYSRWGNHVVTINDINEGWDGRDDGKIVQEDTYIYRINFTDVFHEEHQMTGRVSVVK